jgi:glucosamine--fructose-6-phosphate aminotransferase (isomerizing)
MCGIFGCLAGRDSVPWLVEGLKALEYRGYDSAGVAVLVDGSIERRRVEGKIRDLEEYIKSHPVAGGCGLGHTRWATHGRPCENNAHPHVDCSGRIAIVHNGIIENFAGIKEALSREGHVFQSETDTEVIVHLIEKHFNGRLEDAVRAAAAELEGSFAVAAISVADPQKIVIARNGPPAVLGLGSEGTFISSDITALLKHTDRVVFLDDGELAVITPKGVEYQAFDGTARRKKVETLSWTPARIEKRGFAHFMAKEIFEQPEVVRDALQSRVSLETGNVYLEGLKKVDEVLESVSRVVFISCGTSYHASLVGQYLLETLGGVSADVEYASEFRTRDFVIDPASLVVGISQSGETADTLAALRAVKKMGRPVVAVTNNVSSTMARESDGVIDICAGPEIGVAATKTFIGQLAALTLFALYFAQRKHTLSPAESLALVQELQRVPHKMERILARAGELERLAKELGPCQHYLYLGRWINFPVALEGALKLKEISYVHAEGYAGGEMKHGPIALIDEGLTTFALLPRDRVYQKMAGNIAEVKARNGRIVAVAYEGDRNAARMADTVITVPDVHELLSPLLTVLPLQLYAYYLASSKGLDVDQPRNLAKSVTVE